MESDKVVSSAEKSVQQYEDMKARNAELRQRLREIQQQRRKVAQYQDCCNRATDAILQRMTNNHNNNSYSNVLSCRREKEQLIKNINMMQEWNVISNEAFYIDCEGEVATINGLRLGIKHNKKVTNDSKQQQPSTAASSSTMGFFTLTSVVTAASTTDNTIPWKEINAALGQVVLLLSVLEQTVITHNVIKYELYTCGSTSKIGYRNKGLYNLFYIPDTFQLFAKRNFNIALQYLLGYVHDISIIIQQRDKTIELPHIIKPRQHTIGDLSIAFFIQNNNTNNNEATTDPDHSDWTRAMKYLLTDIKHLMVFRGIGLGRKKHHTHM